MSLLVVMGSGETAPAMVKTHREVFSRSGSGPAAMLDTPFGFQSNADELVARTRTYFAESVGRVAVAPRDRAAPGERRQPRLSLTLTLTDFHWGASKGPTVGCQRIDRRRAESSYITEIT